ncbi:MAG: SUMF1/EgtB/PvdO family nonheme iron enzyme [Leptospiraceae bacterium]|nr:SUMF1/EgtB/PvdO family nonheme iron enzyme [Leptospiraceae bacterium]MCP5502316.1 SUMF1/EgtB/PvdO family nonheme iron enzyme [Leptospiraceae bacterium]
MKKTEKKKLSLISFGFSFLLLTGTILSEPIYYILQDSLAIKQTEENKKVRKPAPLDQSLPENWKFGECIEDIPGMKCIPAGEFIRGSNRFEKDERPEEKVYLSEYYIDIYEVTNEDFQKCFEAGKCKDCLKTGKCKQVRPNYGWRYTRPQQPMVGISWYSAKEYCEFVGKRLPTEAEWEKAARGPDGNLYPWGNEVADCKRAVIEEKGHKGCLPRITEKDWHMHTDNVGTRPPGIYGLFDMAGNSWEWVSDYYTSSYAKCGDSCRGNDPKGPCEGKEPCKGFHRRVVKGGAWWWPGSISRASRRRSHIPENHPEFHHFGFRCAKDSKYRN